MGCIEAFVIIDFETTGLNHTSDQIIELAALKVMQGREIGRLQTFVSLDDGRGISEFITQLTGITSFELVGAPNQSAALELLTHFIGDATVVAQNAQFDLAFLSPIYEPPSFICTRALSRLIEPDQNPSLSKVCERYGINLVGHHRAMNDIFATYEVLKIRLDQAKTLGIEFRNLVIDAPDRPLAFKPKYAKVVKM